MRGTPLVSVIINNYNYARFLDDAIQSACGQTFEPKEVIVVDDGSTDDSRAVIARYAESVIRVLKTNGGQASAFNAGFAASHGDVVCFLDADDTLFPRALATAVPLLCDPSVVKVHWPLQIVDEAGHATGGIVPKNELPEGDCRELIRREGPASLGSAPTSGNAWSRSFLDRILPIPEGPHRLSADAYLFGLAPAFGRVRRTTDPLGSYRIHQANNYHGKSFHEQLEIGCRIEREQWRVLHRHYESEGIVADAEHWRARAWFHRLKAAVGQVSDVIPPNSTVILIDEDRWGAAEIGGGRRCIPFPERDGYYAGRPADDQPAIAELERLRRQGGDYVVVAWPAFWWLEHYVGLHRHLFTFRCIREDDDIVVFDLRNRVDSGLPR